MTIEEIKEKTETGEEFELDISIELNHIYKFEHGILKVNNSVSPNKEFVHSSMGLNMLMSSTLIRKPWKPKVGQKYHSWWYCDFKWSVTQDVFWAKAEDLQRIAFGNCFRTKEECEKHTEMRDKLIEMRKKYV